MSLQPPTDHVQTLEEIARLEQEIREIDRTITSLKDPPPPESTLDLLNRMLDEDPEDWDTRDRLADHYGDDLGDWEAEECLRWQVREKKRPYLYKSSEHVGKWRWWVCDDVHAEDDLPSVFGDNLSVEGDRHYAERPRRYPTRRAAEEDLIAAWKRTPREERPAW